MKAKRFFATIAVIVCLVLASWFGVLAFRLLIKATNKATSSSSTAGANDKVEAIVYRRNVSSMPASEGIFVARILAVMEKLDEGEYPIVEVQNKYASLLMNLTIANPDKKIDRVFSGTLIGWNTNACLYSFAEKDYLELGIVLPAMMNKKIEIDGSIGISDSQSFEIYFVVNLLKEISKLCYIRSGVEVTPQYVEDVELLAWAEIIEDVLLPMSDHFSTVFSLQMQHMVALWEELGNFDTAEWRKLARLNLIE